MLYIAKLRALAFFLVLTIISGCAIGENRPSVLPDSLIGVWASPDYEPSKSGGEPYAGVAIYIARDGLAHIFAAPIAGVMLLAKFDPTTKTVILKSFRSPEQQDPVMTFCYGYNVKTHALLRKTIEPLTYSDDTDTLRSFYKVSGEIPAFCEETFKARRLLGRPYTF